MLSLRALTVYLPLWKWDGVIIAGGTPQDCHDFVSTNMGTEIDVGEFTIGHAYVLSGQPWVLWVADLANIPALAHEALHITSGILEGRGLRHTEDSEEAYTYTMESILRAALARKGWTKVRVIRSRKQGKKS